MMWRSEGRLCQKSSSPGYSQLRYVYLHCTLQCVFDLICVYGLLYLGECILGNDLCLLTTIFRRVHIRQWLVLGMGRSIYPHNLIWTLISSCYTPSLSLPPLQRILQPYVDGVFESIFAVPQGRQPPKAIKSLFDFLDLQASELGIQDPEILHTWKTNRYNR